MTKRFPQKPRRPTTRAMLLPISAATARRGSLEHHMACRMLADGNGSSQILAQLFSAIYGAYFVHLATEGKTGLEMFRNAELALCECGVRAKADGRYKGLPSEMTAIQTVLLLRDEQFQRFPSHVIDAAQLRLLSYIQRPGDDSPIESGSNAVPT
jgi:hypothetical protein